MKNTLFSLIVIVSLLFVLLRLGFITPLFEYDKKVDGLPPYQTSTTYSLRIYVWHNANIVHHYLKYGMPESVCDSNLNEERKSFELYKQSLK